MDFAARLVADADSLRAFLTTAGELVALGAIVRERLRFGNAGKQPGIGIVGARARESDDLALRIEGESDKVAREGRRVVSVRVLRLSRLVVKNVLLLLLHRMVIVPVAVVQQPIACRRIVGKDHTLNVVHHSTNCGQHGHALLLQADVNVIDLLVCETGHRAGPPCARQDQRDCDDFLFPSEASGRGVVDHEGRGGHGLGCGQQGSGCLFVVTRTDWLSESP